jgi:hypothetical protein
MVDQLAIFADRQCNTTVSIQAVMRDVDRLYLRPELTVSVGDLQRFDLINAGVMTGNWVFPAQLLEQLGVIVPEYKRRVRETRLKAIISAAARSSVL